MANKDENVLWIQLITSNTTYYIAVVYIPHGERHHAPVTLKNLALNFTELSLSGTPIIMGDLNIRYNKTGDKQPKESVNTTNKQALKKLLKSTNSSILMDINSILKDNHWTFKFPGGGQSVPDYIIYPTSHTKLVQNYNVNWATNCGSYHAMQTFNLITHGQIKQNFWEIETTESTYWDDSTSKKFKTALINYQLGDISTKQNLEKEAMIFVKNIAKAKKLISKQSSKRKRSTKQTKCEKKMKLLLRKKEMYTKSLNKATKKHLKDSYREKIVLIQRDIHKQAVKRFSEEHYPLWNTLAKIDCSTNAQAFWKTIKKIQKKRI